MANFNIFTTIPAGPNDPADDQPLMQSNNANTAGFLAVDHVAPGVVGAGFHQKVTFKSAPNPIPAAPTDPESIEYTNVGVANNLIQQLYWRNQSGIFPLSSIRAFGLISTIITPLPPGGIITALNGFNISKIVVTGPFLGGVYNYAITLNTNTVDGVNISVFTNTNTSVSIPYTFTGGVLTLTVPGTAGILLSFLILQI